MFWGPKQEPYFGTLPACRVIQKAFQCGLSTGAFVAGLRALERVRVLAGSYVVFRA